MVRVFCVCACAHPSVHSHSFPMAYWVCGCVCFGLALHVGGGARLLCVGVLLAGWGWRTRLACVFCVCACAHPSVHSHSFPNGLVGVWECLLWLGAARGRRGTPFVCGGCCWLGGDGAHVWRACFVCVHARTHQCTPTPSLWPSGCVGVFALAGRCAWAAGHAFCVWGVLLAGWGWRTRLACVCCVCACAHPSLHSHSFPMAKWVCGCVCFGWALRVGGGHAFCVWGELPAR